MKPDTNYILFQILRSVFHNSQMSDADKELVTEEVLPELLKIAQKHDIAHLIALGLLNNKLVGEKIKTQIQQYAVRAMYRYEKLNYELLRVCEALENAKIPYIPLKGSVLRNYYPEPWMRTSCDIDILVHKEDLGRAISYLTEELEYTKHKQNGHDVSLFSPNGVHIELHYDLVEDGLVKEASEILADVWNISTIKEEKEYHYEMSDEMFYFYHIAHMAKHFENGGCGIRPFIDVWILDRLDERNDEKRNNLLRKGDLLKFTEIARKVSRVWFENEPNDTLTDKVENYILSGGIYGTNENRILVQQQKEGGSFNYALSKIFLPYDIIKFHYPILQKHRFLTPVMQVRRWFKLLFCGHVRRSINELSYNKNISLEQANDMKSFLDEIGL